MKTKRILYACTDAVTDALNSGIRAASTLSFSQCIPVHKGIKGGWSVNPEGINRSSHVAYPASVQSHKSEVSSWAGNGSAPARKQILVLASGRCPISTGSHGLEQGPRGVHERYIPWNGKLHNMAWVPWVSMEWQ